MDGHGECGHDISNYVTKTLPGHFVRNKQFAENPKDALKQAFIDTHKAIVRAHAQNQLSATMSGTTVTVAYRKHNQLFCAHTGDSRAIMGVGKDWKNLQAVELTPDHKCELPAEKARIEKANGVVRRCQGDVPHRVFMKGSYLPGLAMSRSLGDLLAHQVGVSHEPDVREDQLTEDSQLLLICSDGVWEFISNERAIELVTKKFGPDQIQEACEVLAAEAWKEWKANEYDVVDDITVIGIVLKKMQTGN